MADIATRKKHLPKLQLTIALLAVGASITMAALSITAIFWPHDSAPTTIRMCCPARRPPITETPIPMDAVADVLGFHFVFPQSLPEGLLPPQARLHTLQGKPIGVSVQYGYDPAVAMDRAPIGLLIVREFVEPQYASHLGESEVIAGRTVDLNVETMNMETGQTGVNMSWSWDGRGYEIGTIGSPTASKTQVILETIRIAESIMTDESSAG